MADQQTRNKLTQGGWNAFKQIGWIWGYGSFGILLMILFRQIRHGQVNVVPENLEWPEWFLLAWISPIIIGGFIFTFSKVPFWVWMQKIKDRFKK